MSYTIIILLVIGARGKAAPAPAPALAPAPAPAPAPASPTFPLPFQEIELHPNARGINWPDSPYLKQTYLQNQLTPGKWTKQQRGDYKQPKLNSPASSNHKIDTESYIKAEAAISGSVAKAVEAIMAQKEMAAKLTELTRLAGETIAAAAAGMNEAENKSRRPAPGQGSPGELGGIEHLLGVNAGTRTGGAGGGFMLPGQQRKRPNGSPFKIQKE